MNSTFSKSIFFASLSLVLMCTMVQALKTREGISKSKLKDAGDLAFAIEVTNNSNATDLQLKVVCTARFGWNKHTTIKPTHEGLKKGDKIRDEFNFGQDFCWRFDTYLFVPDAATETAIDSTHGGFNIAEALQKQWDRNSDHPTVEWGISDCTRGEKPSYCGGPNH